MTVRNVREGYRLVSRKGRTLGACETKEDARKRECQVRYFKHKGK